MAIVDHRSAGDAVALGDPKSGSHHAIDSGFFANNIIDVSDA